MAMWRERQGVVKGGRRLGGGQIGEFLVESAALGLKSSTVSDGVRKPLGELDDFDVELVLNLERDPQVLLRLLQLSRFLEHHDPSLLF